jgi:hypothetical protein
VAASPAGVDEVSSLPTSTRPRGNARERWWMLPRQRGEWFLRTLQERLARPIEQWDAHLTFANLSLTVPQFEQLAQRLQAIIDEVAEETRDQDDEEAVRYSVRLDILPSQNPPRARGAR